jgi:hypothetical protein
MINIETLITSHVSILRKPYSGLRALSRIRNRVYSKQTNSSQGLKTSSVYEVNHISSPYYEVKCRKQRSGYFAQVRIKAINSVNTSSPLYFFELKQNSSEVFTAIARNGGSNVISCN